MKSNTGDLRILYGTDAAPHSWPWMASFQLVINNSRLYRHSCGGSLIDEWHVLTAAHCIKSVKDPKLII